MKNIFLIIIFSCIAFLCKAQQLTSKQIEEAKKSGLTYIAVKKFDTVKVMLHYTDDKKDKGFVIVQKNKSVDRSKPDIWIPINSYLLSDKKSKPKSELLQDSNEFKNW